jgi:GNAT superfamily N-acetyltransferase
MDRDVLPAGGKGLLTLDNPQSYILDPGGEILLAEYGGEIVGVVALVKLDEETFEMAKMAVSPKAQGKGVGELLGRAAIRRRSRWGPKRCTWKAIPSSSPPSTCTTNWDSAR